MHEDSVEAAGLSNAEAKVYLALLEVGETPAGVLVRKTGLHRGTCYAVIDRLLEKGLASSVVREGVHWFSAADPARLLELVEDRRKALEKALPDLEKRRGIGKGTSAVTVFYGRKGAVSAAKSILHELKGGGEYVDMAVSGRFQDVLGDFFPVWQARKRRWNIRSKVVFDENAKQDKELMRLFVGEKRFIPHKYYCTTDTMVFNDKVVLFLNAAPVPIAVFIHDASMAEGYRRIFELMWSVAKP